ncbi:TPA: hypothetical protein O5T45_002631, partial [Staphylococcus aureus]|nr:hypothetical protein [Staphylococcus aureus]
MTEAAAAESENQLEDFVDDSPPEDIEKAKAIGWKDPSEWKGAPPKFGFIKAKQYLERAETVIPIMRSENKKLKDDLAEARQELKTFKDETSKTVAKMAQMSRIALNRQREQLEEKYASAIDAAAEVGDKDEVRKLRAAEREDLKKFDDAAEAKDEQKEEAKKSVNDALPKEVQETIGSWIADNNWYSTDPEMQMVANAHHGKLLKEKPGMTLAENLEETRKYVAKRYPEKFKGEEEPGDEGEEDKPSRGSRVEGGSRMAGGSGGSKFSKLPADAKAQADKFIK